MIRGIPESLSCIPDSCYYTDVMFMQSYYFNLILVYEVMLFGECYFEESTKEHYGLYESRRFEFTFLDQVKYMYSFRVETLKNIGATINDWLLSAISP